VESQSYVERLISSSFEMVQETSMPQLKTLVLMLGMATVNNTPSVGNMSPFAVLDVFMTVVWSIRERLKLD